MDLTEKDKARLLDRARTMVESRLSGKTSPDFPVDVPVFSEKRGAFVTIKKKGQLRGCIGYIQAIEPLHRTIEEMAEAAAFNDPRFPPLTREELNQITFEISVLTPLKAIETVEDIQVGVHGLYIVRDFHAGLLLPQVAVEYRWDRETFLDQTCHKAGLPPRAWKDKETKIYIFSADIFGDSRHERGE